MADPLPGGLSDDAVDLAERASLAAHVDSALLRRLRLRFLPRTDASIEAELWRSDLVESETFNALAFAPDARELLRARLDARRLTETCDEIADHHADGPPLLLLEERLVRHGLGAALADRAAATSADLVAVARAHAQAAAERAAVEAALAEVLRSLEEEADTRGPTIVHWAAQALPRLPAAAQATAAAWALALAAQRTFEREILPGAPPTELADVDLSAYLPDGDVALTIDVDGDHLIFGGSAEQRIEIADTHPRIVVLDRAGTRTVVRIPDGGEVKVADPGYPVDLRDLRGRRWRLHAATVAGAVTEVVSVGVAAPSGPYGRHLSPATRFVDDAAAHLRVIADAVGGRLVELMGAAATQAAVVEAIGAAAARLRAAPTGLFLLAFAGHGGRVPQASGDDADGLDEAWALDDGPLLDDTLTHLLDDFHRDIHVVVIANCCFSAGTFAQPPPGASEPGGFAMGREPTNRVLIAATGERQMMVLPDASRLTARVLDAVFPADGEVRRRQAISYAALETLLQRLGSDSQMPAVIASEPDKRRPAFVAQRRRPR